MSVVVRKNKAKGTPPIEMKLGIIAAAMIAVVAIALANLVFNIYYSDRFLANTYINNKNVSGKKPEQVYAIFGADDKASELTVTTVSGKKVAIRMEDIGFRLTSKRRITEIYEDRKKTSWLAALVGGRRNYEYKSAADFDSEKLEEIIKNTDWGSTVTVDAEGVLSDDGKEYHVVPEVTGDKIVDMQKLIEKISADAADGKADIVLDEDSGVYRVPAVKAEDLKKKCDKMNELLGMSITYDFDYTTETLTGSELVGMLDVHEDQSVDVYEDKAMDYVEQLADKYDTLNKKRSFHATLQGDITVPPSIDAKYGWWIDQEATCRALVQMLHEGKSVDSVDPVYFEDPAGFVYTGVEQARSADDDIGDTYVEVDLTAQHCWYYKNGQLEYECDIVSGQTTSRTRTTFPGVYKLWYKAENFRLSDENTDGDTWDVECDYWNNISLSGIGMHDSQWRGNEFGGDIYKWEGSHGCINMSLEGAKYIYDNVEFGTPVVMYYQSDNSDDWLDY